MYTAYFESKEPNNNYEYYIKLIISQIKECINLSGISYSENPNLSNVPLQTAQIIFDSNNELNSIPADNGGVYIFFIAGNPESKRLATIISKNLGNIYYDSKNVKIISQNEINSDFPNVTIGLGFENNLKDIEWVRENTEEIAKNIVMSLSEYFGLPFVACQKSNIGVTTADVTLYGRPSEMSEIIRSIPANTKVKIVSQWENWYLIGENQHLGYVQNRYVTL